jgi:ubiquinone/menaquinone biosynthesis C-methylase UbiE
LEIGCGTGFVITGLRAKFPQVSFTGSEIFLAGLRFAADRLPGVQLLQMDARHIPFKEEFDVVGAFDVLEHIEEDEAVLTEMFRAVRPGGGIMITVPQHPWLWSQLDDLSYHKRRYTRRELLTKVRAAGFEVKLVTSFVSFLLPLMYLSRLRKKRGEIDIQQEFKIGHTVNLALSAVMRFETMLIRSGIRIHAGGSLLLVATKR